MESPSESDFTKLKNLLQKCALEKAQRITLILQWVAKISKAGVYKIENDDYQEFMQLYMSCIKDNLGPFHLTEKHDYMQ